MKLCYALNHGGLSEMQSLVIRQSGGRNCIVTADGGAVFHDGWASGGIEVGVIAGDDFVLDGRAVLAKLTSKVMDAIQSLETVTLEVS